MLSNKIVVDVVLIPPKEITKLVIDINNGFSETVKENLVLNIKTCLPHITLLMGVAEKGQLPKISHQLAALAKKLSAPNLQITHIDTYNRPNGKILSSFIIEKSDKLQKLHEAILKEMSLFFSYDNVQKEMFYSPPPINKVPTFWVKGFAKNSVRENYEPHITLGYGKPKQLTTPIPIQFKASTLALCHLGNHCTCRDILWSTELK